MAPQQPLRSHTWDNAECRLEIPRLPASRLSRCPQQALGFTVSLNAVVSTLSRRVSTSLTSLLSYPRMWSFYSKLLHLHWELNSNPSSAGSSCWDHQHTVLSPINAQKTSSTARVPSANPPSPTTPGCSLPWTFFLLLRATTSHRRKPERHCCTSEDVLC